jgi:hypothetical protein
MKRLWTITTESVLSAAGWSPTRCNSEMVQGWRAKLEHLSGFQMSVAAERVLTEFGGLRASSMGPGLHCARGGFVLDPELAYGEEDRFAAFTDFVDGKLFPIGEAYDGHAFLGIDEAGTVYLVGDSLYRLGSDIYSALDAILEGRSASMVAERGNW